MAAATRPHSLPGLWVPQAGGEFKTAFRIAWLALDRDRKRGQYEREIERLTAIDGLHDRVPTLIVVTAVTVSTCDQYEGSETTYSCLWN